MNPEAKDMNQEEKSFLDPSKEIQVEEDLKLEGFPLEYEQQMSHIAAGEPDVQPITVNPFKTTVKKGKDVKAYRKKRKSKNKQARKSRRANRKKR